MIEVQTVTTEDGEQYDILPMPASPIDPYPDKALTGVTFLLILITFYIFSFNKVVLWAQF